MSAEKKQPRKRANAAEATSHESTTPATAASVPALQSAGNSSDGPKMFLFKKHPLTVLWREGKPWWIAREVGMAMEYEDGSKLVDLIGDEWADEFAEGTDFVRVTGKALAEVKSVLAQRESGESNCPRSTGVVGKRSPSLLLLSETGMYLATMKTRKPEGKELRRFLASKILPALARGNVLSTATEEQISRAVRVEMDRQHRTPESRQAELTRLGVSAGEVLGRLVERDPSQVRSWVIELAKGLVGYGGSGRELGYVSTRQFKAMRMLLCELPKLVMLAPKSRRRRMMRAIESGDGAGVQQVLPIFRAQADVGNAVVTVTVEQKKPEAA